MIPKPLSPKARELLRRIEEREAKRKDKPGEVVATATSPKPSMANCLMSPEALDALLAKPNPQQKRRR